MKGKIGAKFRTYFYFTCDNYIYNYAPIFYFFITKMFKSGFKFKSRYCQCAISFSMNEIYFIIFNSHCTFLGSENVHLPTLTLDRKGRGKVLWEDIIL